MTYERLVEAAKDGSATAKWILRKYVMFEILEALKNLATLSNDEISELAKVSVKIMESEEKSVEDLRKLLKRCSDTLKIIADRASLEAID